MAGNVYTWSTTAAANATIDADINFAENQLPGTLNDSNRGIMAGVAGFIKDNNATISTTGSANAYLATSSNTIAALATGISLRLKVNFTNTGACTLNLTPQGGVAFGAKAIRIIGVTGERNPAPSEIQTNGIYEFNYDAAANGAAGGWVLLNSSVFPGVATQVFTSSGTYTPTAGMQFCIIECVGGGGGGGGVSGTASQYYIGGGGGAGAYSRKLATAATVGASQAVTVGAAGAGGVGAANGAAGTTTNVGGICSAGGGGGANFASNASAPASGSQGAVGTGDVSEPGQAGSSGWVPCRSGLEWNERYWTRWGRQRGSR